jgi:hypothetical protein
MTKAGVKLVNDGCYLTVKYNERTPLLATDTFALDDSIDMIQLLILKASFTQSSLALEPATASIALQSSNSFSHATMC